jgi:hypothetical protein
MWSLPSGGSHPRKTQKYGVGYGRIFDTIGVSESRR